MGTGSRSPTFKSAMPPRAIHSRSSWNGSEKIIMGDLSILADGETVDVENDSAKEKVTASDSASASEHLR